MQQNSLNYRPQRSCEGYVFTGVCLSTRRGVCLSACWDTTHKHPPPEQKPPPQRDGHCCGRYASYWNAFLFVLNLTSYSSLKVTCYRLQRSCSKVMFSQACVKNSVHSGGLSPSMHQRSHALGGGSTWGVSVLGGLCPGGLCLGGSLSKGVYVQGSLLGRPPPDRDPPCKVTGGRYASFWNAFLF